jgi:hypothetical protein
VEEWETRVVEHFRRTSTARPRTQKKLVSFLIAFFGQKITEGEALARVAKLRQTGQFVINDKGGVTYQLDGC